MLIEVGFVISVIADWAVFDGSAKLATVRMTVCKVLMIVGAV